MHLPERDAFVAGGGSMVKVSFCVSQGGVGGWGIYICVSFWVLESVFFVFLSSQSGICLRRCHRSILPLHYRVLFVLIHAPTQIFINVKWG